MHPTIVLISVFAIFIPALMLPGPDFVAVVRSSMTRGTMAGLLTTIGVSAGLGIYATLGLLGLSAILMKFHWLAWSSVSPAAPTSSISASGCCGQAGSMEVPADATSEMPAVRPVRHADQSQGDRAFRQRVRDVGDR